MINRNSRLILQISLLFIFFVELLRSAWLSDDAQITLRVVLNFLHGYGPIFNIDERVQAYTHPLWFFMLSTLSFVSPFIFFNIFLLPIAISLLTFWLFLTRLSVNFSLGVVAAIGLMLSKAYLDFSTSGLENPLAHLLLVCLILCVYSQRFKLFFFLTGLLYLTRVDLCLIVLPIIFLLFKQVRALHPTKRCFYLIIIGGFLPLCWTLFSLYYYGLPFPNTAYAKLHTGISLTSYLHQGMLYLVDSFERDPLTLGMISMGILIGFFGDELGSCLSCGIILYLIYIVFIGGDFMTGRFLTSPLLIASMQIARLPWRKTSFYVIASGIIFIGGMNIDATLFCPLNYYKNYFKRGIADERGFYFQQYGLLNAQYLIFITPSWSEHKPRMLFAGCGNLGKMGVLTGPSAHIIDTCGLADPLLSHLPQQYKHYWRIGHFQRAIPRGYFDSITHNQNLLIEPILHADYDKIRLITRGELNDPRRLKEVIRFNFDQ